MIRLSKTLNIGRNLIKYYPSGWLLSAGTLPISDDG